MRSPIEVVIVDSAGSQQTFCAGHVLLDCGCGCIDIRPGGPAFCRGFEHGTLTVDDGSQLTTVKITRGMASLTGDAVHVTCEAATASAPVPAPLPDPLPDPNLFPAQPAEATKNNQHPPNNKNI